MIVTQDRMGKKLIEKAGILVQAKAEGLEEEEADNRDLPEENARSFARDEDTESLQEKDEAVIGSDSFFEEAQIARIQTPAEEQEKEKERKKELPMREKDEVSGPENFLPKAKGREENKVKMSDIVMNENSPQRKKKSAKPTVRNIEKEKAPQAGNFSMREAKRQQKVKAENFFQSSFPAYGHTEVKEEKMLKTTRVKGKAGKYFVFFIISFFLLLSVAAAYYFLPSAQVIVSLGSQEKSVSQVIDASVDASERDPEQAKIPAIREEIIKEKSLEFEATGTKSSTGKAGGSVVIYNEFSSDNQALVGTTRLETADGKIFRIKSGVIVPGMAQLGGEKKPGAIEVEVIADKPGEEFNIGPSDFKIPGFKGGPKYDKFFAKSSKPMTGGGQGETATVSVEDIASAKEKVLAEAKKETMEEWKNKFGANRRFFDSVVKAELLSSASSEKSGAQAEKFTFSAKVRILTLSFSEDDVRKVIEKKQGSGSENSPGVRVGANINYLLAESDLEKGTMRFEAKTDALAISELDMENFKKGVLGKKSEQIESLVQSYPAIKKVDVKFWPFFADRVPLNEKRVNIEIKN